MTFADLGAVLAAMSLGAMLFFSAFVAPTTFKVLPEENAGAFLRALFPNYFEVNGVVAIVAGLLALQPIPTTLLIVAGALMIGVKYVLIPKINDARDRMVTGSAEAKQEFDSRHRLSVTINLIEMVLLVIAIVFLLS